MNLESSFMAMQSPQATMLSFNQPSAMAQGLAKLDAFMADDQTATLQAAAAHFAQALIEDDSNAEAYRCLAFIYSAFSQHETAIDYVQIAAALEPDVPGLNALKRLIYTAERMEDEDFPFHYPFEEK